MLTQSQLLAILAAMVLVNLAVPFIFGAAIGNAFFRAAVKTMKLGLKPELVATLPHLDQLVVAAFTRPEIARFLTDVIAEVSEDVYQQALVTQTSELKELIERFEKAARESQEYDRRKASGPAR